MGQSYNKGSAFDYELQKRMEALHVDDIQHNEQGNIIYDELEQKQRNSEHWQGLEKKYGINYGDVVDLDGLGRVQELYVSEGVEHNNGLISDTVHIELYGGAKMEDFACAEVGMTAKEWLKDIKIQPQEKEKKLSIKDKIKNTLKTKVQTLKKTLKKGGAADRLANRRTHEKATNAQTKPSASQTASQRLKNKRALHNTQGLER
jgi:hypothetical protein